MDKAEIGFTLQKSLDGLGRVEKRYRINPDREVLEFNLVDGCWLTMICNLNYVLRVYHRLRNNARYTEWPMYDTRTN
ncbi:hypothetical protein [Paenibacillus sp. Soil522]|uniref:hypothetical protein n=1 Tax=Paenibacillus sp. Soil522 TaxID=1736388 RepID=UPI0006FF46DF|nr:hypothetical protein [Paenibacillus sp. Soil522]KRE35296.1 hypothetical protein ASG81_22285 [Paenibacillus sp. Soil522]